MLADIIDKMGAVGASTPNGYPQVYGMVIYLARSHEFARHRRFNSMETVSPVVEVCFTFEHWKLTTFTEYSVRLSGFGTQSEALIMSGVD